MLHIEEFSCYIYPNGGLRGQKTLVRVGMDSPLWQRVNATSITYISTTVTDVARITETPLSKSLVYAPTAISSPIVWDNR
ncbi:hypothetical protein IC006_2122 [Sulfuracidifex tepidarius]|uniref:Uncharacterized protein n=1 Tax=Sulfuracidifex tepidarius TaxID=1294262 RepID=A0A510DXV0_9CREN|nr:hypothetical protein IC006_2122 [Sulfuracidifex tepidarius]